MLPVFSGAIAGMLEWATSFEAHRLVILLVMFIVLIWFPGLALWLPSLM